MQNLTNKEDEIMQILWKLKKAFVKEVQAKITEDQTHYNTLQQLFAISKKKVLLVIMPLVIPINISDNKLKAYS